MTQNAPHQPLREDGRLRIGQPFNPWHKVCGLYPPDIVGRQRDLTDGQKRLYERAVRWAGKNGVFWHGFKAMAEALGKSPRQVKDDMAALEAKGLISHFRRRRNSNVYSFLWHSMFEVQPTALQQVGLEVQDSTLEVQDDVVLEVQPTALESSQLESCPLNSEKADSKRISGDASQKQRSAASSPVMRGAEIPKDKTPKADGAPSSSWGDPNPREVETSAKGWTQRELAEVRRRIVAFWGREPEEGFEISVMLRARGSSAAAVCDLLDRKYANPNCRPGGRLAPRNQNWFLTVIENEFFPGHLSEPPALPRREDPVETEIINRGIEAIELPDAPRSIVESVRCDRCGGQALVRYTDDTIDGCQCRNKPGRDLERMRVASALGFHPNAPANRRSAGE
jgi:hypothetical protein